jgi:hypothetical protein
VLQLDFYPFYVGARSATPVGSISIPNPLYGNYPQWTPEQLPAVKKAGDLEVRLDDLKAGTRLGGAPVIMPNGSIVKPYDPATKFDFSVRSSRGTNEVWVLESAELSDATGNVIRDRSFRSFGILFNDYNRPQKFGWASYSESIIRGMLWPDGAAWRLKMEFKRASGFASEEVVTFKNVPVPAMGTTNTTPISKNAGGIQVVLKKFGKGKGVNP